MAVTALLQLPLLCPSPSLYTPTTTSARSLPGDPQHISGARFHPRKFHPFCEDRPPLAAGRSCPWP